MEKLKDYRIRDYTYVRSKGGIHEVFVSGAEYLAMVVGVAHAGRIKITDKLTHDRPVSMELVNSDAPVTRTAWVIENGMEGENLLYRCWLSGASAWTSEITIATQYARKVDADTAHSEDGGAWVTVEHTFGAEDIQEFRQNVKQESVSSCLYASSED